MATGSKRKREQNPRVYGKQHKARRQSPSAWLDLESADEMSWVPSKPNFKSDPLIPKRPMNQKAATMPSEPDAEQVNTLVEITGVDPRLAIRFLKVSLVPQFSGLFLSVLRMAVEC